MAKMTESQDQIGTEPEHLERLRRQLTARTREISALERAARVFEAVVHPSENLYRSLAQQAAELLEAQIAVILLYDTERQVLVAQVPAVGVPDNSIQDYEIPLDKNSPARHIWQTVKELIIDDAATDPLVRQLNLDHLARELDAHAVLTTGLRHEGRLLGAIQLCNKRDGTPFDADDARLLSIFASQVAIAIQNMRLFEQARRHAEEMASLYEMASSLTNAEDLDEILNTVLAHVHRVLDYDGCLISLASADGQALRVRAAVGQDVESLQGIDLSTDQGINAWIYREGKPTLVHDAETDPRRLHIEGRTEAIRSAVGAPLIANDQIIGTMYAIRREPRAFGEAHLRFLDITATQVSAAVQRVRLLDQARRRAKEMESISNIGAVMASSLDVDHVLQTIYEQAAQIMDTRAFFIALYDADRDELDFHLVYDQGQRLEAFVRSMAANQGLTAHVVRTGQPLLIRDMELEAEPLEIAPMVLGEPSRSWLGVPMIAKGQILGVISAQSYEPYAFSNRQMRLLSAIANQAGISLQNAQLYQTIQEAHQVAASQRDKLTLLHRVVVKVQQTQDLAAKLQIIADAIHQVGWGRVSVSLRDADFNVRQLVCAGFVPQDEAALRANLLPGDAWKVRFSQEFERFRIGMCYYLPWSDPWVREHVQGVKSRLPESEMDTWHPQDLLYVLLYGRDQRIMGIIGLDDPQDGRRPTSGSLHIIELFAQEAALTIENAQLLADMKLLNTDLQEMVDAQARLLQTVEDLASPVVPIVDGVIVLPLIGYVYARRAGQILTTLLKGVEEHNAQIVILDVTGVPVIDTQVAHHLMQSVRALRLVGAEAVLVGIRPDVAQTLVALDVHLGDVITRSDLQSGFQYALTATGRRLTPGREAVVKR
jgi:GAF domain-containing protein/anti-anti-sigma regulatory factor